MPNWCSNNLCVTGDKKELQDFVEKSTTQEGKDFSFNGTFPMNDDLDISAGTHNTDEEEQRVLNKGLYGHSNWYEWRICEWGTKWDADEAEINHNEGDYFNVLFQTAWAPPIDWLKNIAMDYPNLEFELQYEETGMCFGGTFTIQGNDEHDAQWELESASECCQGPINWEHEDFEQQCLICGEETVGIMINVDEVKSPTLSINTQKEFNQIVNKLKNNED